MISLKAFQASFTPTKHPISHTKRLPISKNGILCLCKSKPSDSEAPPPEGDVRKQELLARIAMLQAQKVRLTDYLDDTSAHLTKFAEEASAEYDKIGEEALKGLDEAGAALRENMDSQMKAYEESAELHRQEIERNENKLLEFEAQIEKDRNEGMFFKSLRQRAPVDKSKAREEMNKIKDLSKEKAGSRIRRYIYLGLISIVIIAIADSFISSSPDWRKVAVLGAILVGLVTQLSYEQSISSETEGTDKENTDGVKK